MQQVPRPCATHGAPHHATLGSRYSSTTQHSTHSCAPNSIYVTNGKTISVRAIENIESFSDVRISYIQKYPLFRSQETAENRKKELKDHYHFDCNCRLCDVEEKYSLKSSVMCPKHEKCGTVVKFRVATFCKTLGRMNPQ